jgi:ABC-type multidrug transport system fused ATPase/permease subunit
MDVRHTLRNGGGPDAEDVTSSGAAVVWSAAVKGATIGIFLLLLCVIVVEARSLLMPIVSGIVIGMMFSPLVTLAARYHVPSWLSALMVTAGVLVIANVALTLLSVPLVDWLNRASEIGQLLSEKLRFLERTLAAIDDVRKALTRGEGGLAVKIDTGLSSLVAPVLATLTPALGSLLIFFGTLYFFLLGREPLRRGLVLFFAGREMRLRVMRILSDIEQNLTRSGHRRHHQSRGRVPDCCGRLSRRTAESRILGRARLRLELHPLYRSVHRDDFSSFRRDHQLTVTRAGVDRPGGLRGHHDHRRPFPDPKHPGASPDAQSARGLPRARVLDLGWGPIGAFLATPLLIVGAAALDHMRPADGPALPG